MHARIATQLLSLLWLHQTSGAAEPIRGSGQQPQMPRAEAVAEAIPQGLTPEESAKTMQLADGLEVSVVASEPTVRQPVAIDFDDRGRLWVIQYLQYPNPAGLQRVAVDRFSRTRYDRIPEPPPHGPRGADRISILSDVDGDGRMETATDFVDGLNLATGFAFGHGGVFVLNVPYLLFYPDRNRDDIPDTDPEVLLTGFGMEDAHSVANSLTFGPDGWLYGCQGSTVTANIRGIEFQQGVWRYHPITREFELFCEGGGNCWGLDFDAAGELLYSTNYGGHTLVHGVQGGYYVKSFGKHGALHNPHAYGYFEHAPHQNFRGGHVTVGGLVYQENLLPQSFRGTYIAGDLLGHGVYWHQIQPLGSSVRTAHGGELLSANDTWFAPTDVTVGPDGAIYVSDWNDVRTAHPDPDADWDRTNGRIFRIAPRKSSPSSIADFSTQSTEDLLALHGHSSQWFVRRARQELVRRFHSSDKPADAEVFAPLTRQLTDQAISHSTETMALESLWTLSQLGGFDEPLAFQLLNSPHSTVRAWTIRLLGDRREISLEMAHRLDEFAEQEPDVHVRRQLACSAARFPAGQAMPMINANINRDLDGNDPFLPLLWWWAVEKHSVAGREEVLKRFVRPSLWKSHLGRDVLLPRLIRRYSAERTPAGLDSVARLLQAAPNPAARLDLWPEVVRGWQELPQDAQTAPWRVTAQSHAVYQNLLTDWENHPNHLSLLWLGLWMHHQPVFEHVAGIAFDMSEAPAIRESMLQLLTLWPQKTVISATASILQSQQPDQVRTAALRLLAQHDTEQTIPVLLQQLKQEASPALRSQLIDALVARPASASAWLNLIDKGELAADSATLEQVRRIALLKDESLNATVAKHWGRLQSASPEEKLAEVRRLNNDLRAASGDSQAGQLLFRKHCAVCHQLFGEGAKVGPELTTANRKDRDFLLVSLVDPSSVIRREYVSLVIQTTDGRVVTGLPAERSESEITLVDSKGEKQTLAVSQIEELQDSSVSLMPENLYRQFSPQQLRDLFAWIQK